MNLTDRQARNQQTQHGRMGQQRFDPTDSNKKAKKTVLYSGVDGCCFEVKLNTHRNS